MIANRGRGRMVGASSFGASIDYIVREGPEHERDHAPPLAIWSENVATLETAALEMEAVASQSRAKEPLYHLIVSFAEGERPTYEQARAALDTQIRHLGFDGLQYVAALQNDGVGGMYHVHAVFNRVNPLTHVARDIWQDREKMRAASREAELEQGWRVVEVAQRQELSHGARDVEYYGRKRSFERSVREDVGPAIRVALSKESPSWADVHRVCHERNIRYEEVRVNGEVQGGRLVGAERGEYARARDLGPDLTHRKLVERLGTFERDRDQDRSRDASQPFLERCRAAAVEVEVLRGTDGRTDARWREVHAAFERHGVEYKSYRTGARIGDLDSPETVKPSEIDRELSLKAMTATFGPYESSQQARDRAAAREAVQRAENLVIGARLLEDPSPIMERLTANNATYTLSAVERLVGERVFDVEQRAAITEKIVDQSVPLVDERGKNRLTTREVLETEQTLAAAADGLASQRRDIQIVRPAGDRLDEQQQRAYAYTIDDAEQLKVITGVPGAGKTQLIREIGTAYQEAGYNVRAVSVANSAVEILRRETDVPARSVAKELYEWGQDRERLTNRDLLIIDEASTLGTAQGAALLCDAHERGAVVIALGDDKQFQSVAHGNALELMQRAAGERSIDLEKTRRQQEAWQRDATEAVRRGEVRDAIGAYRDRGFVRESATQNEARTAVVEQWRALESSGVECGIEAYTNRERIAVNALARDEWRAMGRVAGADQRLETVDGNVPYAVGDRVIIRETIREAGLHNGSVGTVRAIDDATLHIERRDGMVVPVDTREHPGVQHGYCSTEYREQGTTRYAELQLVTEHVHQRSLTVGMTRHTDAYEMFYSREAVGSYDDLVALGLRTRSKELASDYRELERAQTREPKRDLTIGELRRELEPIAQGRDASYTRDERKAAFDLLNRTERLERDDHVTVGRDWHATLGQPRDVKEQVRELSERVAARSAEREQSKEHERGWSW